MISRNSLLYLFNEIEFKKQLSHIYIKIDLSKRIDFFTMLSRIMLDHLVKKLTDHKIL